METIIRIVGAAVCALAASLILRDKHKTIAVVCVSAAFVLILSALMKGSLSEFGAAVGKMADGTGFADYAVTLAKALGIAYITGAASELCRGCGEGGLAFAVNTAGKAEILLLAQPMAVKLLDIARSLLAAG